MIDELQQFFKNLSNEFTSIVFGYTKEDYILIDLSITNTDLSTIDISSSKAFEKYIKEYLINHNAKIAYGGYNEIRGIYKRSTHFNTQNSVTERNIHLGIDIWCDAGTKIVAPLGGKIHSFKNNTNHGDYGPTIIIEHTIHMITFYTLYGHLSMLSITDIEIGEDIKAGQIIADLGESAVNGDYAPHLHFQIIIDIDGNVGDYPGVSNTKDLKYYLQNCPDPNLLLKI
ncbi:peptidoglycan DD-metalloendopeptidase family protein [Aquimarina longa]|uniref:peptidoglycan DD-metalloendopeptidase family protein n=1 Tax=Aquimarina longa TaxID=1080221 RepID=UPI00078331AA|nr:peptidoglycan DD-metalloendopeptidase family protein [Aquimarina longa]